MHAFATHPGDVYTLARARRRACSATLALWLLYLTGARLFGRGVGLLAAAIEAVAFLPVFYAHLALNDAPTLAPVTLSLLGSAGVLCKGRVRDYLLAGSAWVSQCATKYTAGIVLVPFAAAVAARYLDGAARAAVRAGGRWARSRWRAGGAGGVPDRPILTRSSTTAAFTQNWSTSPRCPPKRRASSGAPREGGLVYYLWSLSWGLGWVPALAALGGP